MKTLIDYILEVTPKDKKDLWLSDHEIFTNAYENYVKERKPKKYHTHPYYTTYACLSALRRESKKENGKVVFSGYVKSISFLTNKEYDHPYYKIVRR